MVRVRLRHDGQLVPQQLLHLLEIDAALHQHRREHMAQIMEVEILDFLLPGARRNTPQMTGLAPSSHAERGVDSTLPARRQRSFTD